MGRIRRPPSYSDSFYFTPDDGLLVVYTPAPAPTPTPKKTLKLKIAKRAISFLFHILLISIFETLFFFLFISKSEDMGIQNTINGYVQGVVSQCSAWSKNESAAITDILALFLNASDVLSAAARAGEERRYYNLMLQVQAWVYVLILLLAFAITALAYLIRDVPIKWKSVLVDNVCMIVLLGLYEYFFFRTIIYKYQSLSDSELDGNIVTQLQTQCGLLIE
uniref:Uncharacterized protein n=1 Tax=viral metagenome TaxID=1070528 RepID=A0A6C0HL09_9ZZZZ